MSDCDAPRGMFCRTLCRFLTKVTRSKLAGKQRNSTSLYQKVLNPIRNSSAVFWCSQSNHARILVESCKNFSRIIQTWKLKQYPKNLLPARIAEILMENNHCHDQNESIRHGSSNVDEKGPYEWWIEGARCSLESGQEEDSHIVSTSTTHQKEW
jgi:hypothetical protein